ncbi:MAG: RDD family protein [Robiginitalea sp.]|uniref:RDD family protein n=1 Tax=Robiginitalea sp. TaxID=1902411 RepID=UPI003C79237C
MNERNLRRFAALIIDYFLISIVYSVVINVVPDTLISHQEGGIQWGFTLVPDGLVLVSLGYFFGCDFLNKGESLGKDIMGLQTRNADGGILVLRRRLCRTLLKWVSLILWPLAFPAYFWKERDLTLQDTALKTAVTLARRFKPTL